jgi:hypothetical protein
MTTTRVTTRPSLDIPFYKWTDEFITYTDEFFVKTNKLLYYKMEISADGLTETRSTVWNSQLDYMDYTYLGSNEWAKREEYQSSIGIVSMIQEIPAEANSVEEVKGTVLINLRDYL